MMSDMPYKQDMCIWQHDAEILLRGKNRSVLLLTDRNRNPEVGAIITKEIF